MYLHNHPNFKDLIELTAKEQGIFDPYLVEKDYWIMHSLYGLSMFGLKMELKGGTSLSKAYKVIHRFSEDIDIKIEPDESRVGFEVYFGKNHDKPKHRESKKNYFDWLALNLKGTIDGITNVVRDVSFDDEKYRNGGIRLLYETQFTPVEGLKEGILLEVGFDKTTPNKQIDISSWAYDKGVISLPNKALIDNRALQVSCYDPRYTFVEKLQAVVTKYSFYKDQKKDGKLPVNFLRHYYDLYCLLELDEVKEFVGTSEYEDYKKERFRNYDTKIKSCDGFTLKDANDREVFKLNYAKSSSLYYKGQVDFDKILLRFAEYLEIL
jgi:hypothetical protein